MEIWKPVKFCVCFCLCMLFGIWTKDLYYVLAVKSMLCPIFKRFPVTPADHLSFLQIVLLVYL